MKLHVLLGSIWTSLTMGQAVKASSLPVVIASDQLGAAAKAAALPVTMATDQPAIKIKSDGNYETVAASQADQVLGATGAAGDYLDSVTIVPGTTSPGAVSIKDGGGAAITIFAGGASSVADLAPITVKLGIVSAAGAWKVTTGADVTVIAAGLFT